MAAPAARPLDPDAPAGQSPFDHFIYASPPTGPGGGQFREASSVSAITVGNLSSLRRHHISIEDDTMSVLRERAEAVRGVRLAYPAVDSWP